MHFFRFIGSVRPAIQWLVAISFILLLVKILILNHYPAIFPRADELGQVVERLLASILASYIFFLIVVHLKDYSNRRTIYPYVAQQVSSVIGDCISMLSDISKESGHSVSLEANVQSVQQAFVKLAPGSQAPLLLNVIGPLVYANWIQYFVFYRNRTRKTISRLFTQLIYLDAELVRLLLEFDRCTYFIYLDAIEAIPVGGKDLTHMTKVFDEYCRICEDLSTYKERKLTRYLDNV